MPGNTVTVAILSDYILTSSLTDCLLTQKRQEELEAEKAKQEREQQEREQKLQEEKAQQVKKQQKTQTKSRTLYPSDSRRLRSRSISAESPEALAAKLNATLDAKLAVQREKLQELRRTNSDLDKKKKSEPIISSYAMIPDYPVLKRKNDPTSDTDKSNTVLQETSPTPIITNNNSRDRDLLAIYDQAIAEIITKDINEFLKKYDGSIKIVERVPLTIPLKDKDLAVLHYEFKIKNHQPQEVSPSSQETTHTVLVEVILNLSTELQDAIGQRPGNKKLVEQVLRPAKKLHFTTDGLKFQRFLMQEQNNAEIKLAEEETEKILFSLNELKKLYAQEDAEEEKNRKEREEKVKQAREKKRQAEAAQCDKEKADKQPQSSNPKEVRFITSNEKIPSLSETTNSQGEIPDENENEGEDAEEEETLVNNRGRQPPSSQAVDNSVPAANSSFPAAAQAEPQAAPLPAAIQIQPIAKPKEPFSLWKVFKKVMAWIFDCCVCFCCADPFDLETYKSRHPKPAPVAKPRSPQVHCDYITQEEREAALGGNFQPVLQPVPQQGQQQNPASQLPCSTPTFYPPMFHP